MFSQTQFDAKMFLSESLNAQLIKVSQDLALRAVQACAEMYGFDADEAITRLNLSNVSMKINTTAKKSVEKKTAAKKEKVFNPLNNLPPLPYSGEYYEENCHALKKNYGLYTQCPTSKMSGESYCKACLNLSIKNDGVPVYGTVWDRQMRDYMEYVDPKGNKPIPYCRIMKRFALTKERVLECAEIARTTIADVHFQVLEEPVKKVVREKKGRPKKQPKTVQVSSMQDSDLDSEKEPESDQKPTSCAILDALVANAAEVPVEDEYFPTQNLPGVDRLEARFQFADDRGDDDEDEEDEVPTPKLTYKKIKVQSVKYLMCVQTNEVYNLGKYESDQELLKIGTFNSKEKKIEFLETDELVEDIFNSDDE